MWHFYLSSDEDMPVTNVKGLIMGLCSEPCWLLSDVSPHLSGSGAGADGVIPCLLGLCTKPLNEAPFQLHPSPFPYCSESECTSCVVGYQAGSCEQLTIRMLPPQKSAGTPLPVRKLWQNAEMERASIYVFVINFYHILLSENEFCVISGIEDFWDLLFDSHMVSFGKHFIWLYILYLLGVIFFYMCSFMFGNMLCVFCLFSIRY